MEEKIINKIEKIIPQFVSIARQMWIDYDQEADVLYISFAKPQNADDSIMDGNFVFLLCGSIMLYKPVFLTIKHVIDRIARVLRDTHGEA